MSNRLLSSLSNDELSELELELVSFEFGAELNKVGKRPEHVYFPEDGLLLLLQSLRMGRVSKLLLWDARASSALLSTLL